MSLGMKNSHQSSSSPGDMSLMQPPEKGLQRRVQDAGEMGGNRGASVRPGGDKQKVTVGSRFVSTSALLCLQAQGFSSEKYSLT